MKTWMFALCCLVASCQVCSIGCRPPTSASSEADGESPATATSAAAPLAELAEDDGLRWDDQLSEWTQAAHAHESAERYSEAIAQWEQIRGELLRGLPPDHWQVVNCDWAIRMDRRLSQLTPDEQTRFARLQELDQTALRQALVGAARNALDQVREARQIAEQLFGSDSVLPVNIRFKTARLAVQIDEWDLAAQEFQAGIDTALRLWPAVHPELELAYADLAAVELERGHEATAVEFLAKAHQTALGLYGPDHLQTARRANDLGVALHRAGQLSAALEALAAAERARRNLQASPTLIAECELNAAAVLIDLQRWDEARGKLQSICDADQREPLAAAVITEARSNRATLFTLEKDFAAAAAELELILASIRESLGDLNPRYADFSYRLGMNLGFQGKFADAETKLRHALSVQTNLLGKESPSTRKSAQALAAVLERLGRSTEATDLAVQYSVPRPAATSQN